MADTTDRDTRMSVQTESGSGSNRAMNVVTGAGPAARRLDLPSDLRSAFAVERLPYRRTMTPEEIARLQGVSMGAFSVEVSRELIENIMHYCLHVERRIDGRAAGHVEDLILRYLLRLIASTEAEADSRDPCHLEIGALFGATTIYSCHAVKLAGKKIRTVVIDPFAGYYDQSSDPVSGATVSEDVFWSNLRRFGFGNEEVRVLKGLSTDVSIVKECSGMKFHSLLIDGDHSYEGVKQDWLNYANLVVPGGYVMIDDYNNIGWPDITRFVNNEILPYLAGRWSPILVYSNTLILKRTDLRADLSLDEELMHRFEGARHTIEIQGRRLARLERELKSLRESGSWKVTTPLRWLRRMLLRILQNR